MRAMTSEAARSSMELNDYSSRFLWALLEAFPEFREHLSTGPGMGCFTIAFPAPSGCAFWVSTEEEERITVGLDCHHDHFGGWAESIDAEDFARTIGYIRGMMKGTYVIAVWERGGVLARSV